MSISPSADSLARFPPEMLTVVAEDAKRDGDDVGWYLSNLGLAGTPEHPVFLPAEFLIRLASALRLLRWEAHGFFMHVAAGLPKARDAIREAFISLTDSGGDATQFNTSVLRLSIERFAWNAQHELHADVALDNLDEEAALDALAEYLWATRYDAITRSAPNQR